MLFTTVGKVAFVLSTNLHRDIFSGLFCKLALGTCLRLALRLYPSKNLRSIPFSATSYADSPSRTIMPSLAGPYSALHKKAVGMQSWTLACEDFLFLAHCNSLFNSPRAKGGSVASLG